jgi:crotonobetainyl-CoA:carnitine CoA-transferase CaiB-like acyl-CoA transferase
VELDERGTCVVSYAHTGALAEPIAQAVSGLMSVHGRPHGRPRRLGLNVASVATGILATQAALALQIRLRRGLPIGLADTGLTRGALQFMQHHLAIATCGDSFPYSAHGPVGTPFPTADHAWIELEVMSADDWIGFWRALGLDDARLVGGAWLPFVYRYLAGECRLPAELHEATSRHRLHELRRLADAFGVALSPIRSAPDEALLGQPLWSITSHACCGPARPGAPATGEAALAGLRVLDLGSRLQGPLAALLLQMMGAEVIRIEPPGGDFGRLSPPVAGGTGAAYLAYNRGKRVLEIDYKSAAGRAEILELASASDVLLHNWRGGRAQCLRLDAADVAQVNPSIIYAHASGWGNHGDAPSDIAGDFLVQAYAGCAAIMSPPTQPAFPSGVTLIDVVGGLLTCEAVLAALVHRERDGRGRRIDTSLLAAAVSLQVQPRCHWRPLDHPIRTQDGYLVVSVDHPELRRHLARLVGGGLESDDDRIAARLAAGSAWEWADQLGTATIPAAVVCEDLTCLSSQPATRRFVERDQNACWTTTAPWTFP